MPSKRKKKKKNKSKAAAGESEDEGSTTSPPPNIVPTLRRTRRPGPPRILVDCLHAKENNPDQYNNNKCDYEYYNNYSYFRVFRHLQQHGMATFTCWWGDEKGKTITPELLEGFDMLFINLMHEEAPFFTTDEINCIHHFIETGGSLVMIGEHTNAYHHAEKLNPLLKPLGIEMLWASALEARQEFATMPPGWVLVRNFDRLHPTSKDITTIHMMAAGVFSLPKGTVTDSTGQPPRSHGVALLSDEGWAGPSGPRPPSFYGDTKWQPGMPKGNLPVAVVSEFGAGRVYAVSDQNMYGDGHLYFRHNFRHFMNIMEWSLEAILQLEPSIPRPFRDVRPSGLMLGVDMRFRPYSGAKEGPADFHGFYFTMSRDHDIIPKGIRFGERELKDRPGFDDDDSSDCAVLIFPEPTEAVAEEHVSELIDLVWSGKTLILLLNLATLTLPALDLLSKLLPDFSFTFGPGERVSLKEVGGPVARVRFLTRLHRSMTPGVPVCHRLHSASLDVRHVALEDCVLPLVSSQWGVPFLQTNGELFDAALGCLATQSSELGPGYVASNAVDGNPATHTHTQPLDTRPWLLLDLQSVCPVQRVVLVNRIQGQTERLRDVRVELLAEDKRTVVWTSPPINPGGVNTALYYTVEVWKNGQLQDSSLNLSLSPSSNGGSSYDHIPMPVQPLASKAHGVLCRYVRVFRVLPQTSSLLGFGGPLAGANVLSLGQVQVLCPVSNIDPLQQGLVNVAPQGVAIQSSDEGQGDKALNALDGSLETFTHTKFSDSEPWWQVDLKEVFLIKVVILQNRTDGWMCRLSDLTVTLSDMANEVVWTSGLVNPNDMEKGPCQINLLTGGGVKARYVKVSRKACRLDWEEGDRNVLSLVQVKVMAVATSVHRLASQSSGPVRAPVYDIARIGPITARRRTPPKQQIPFRNINPSSKKDGGTATAADGKEKVKTEAGKLNEMSKMSEEESSLRRGNVVVFLTDTFWRNRFLHPYLDKRPRVSGTNAVWLEYAMLDWLKHVHKGNV
eukprot:gb/GEZN01001346.1/.p1 GENE.gb/GEZN01001346.1/~~gb/GEZN01001346.1/.p1  ORF type:complete len:1014 (+),score=102.87 gb/GEZN01001346.1/:48-3089(+)